MNSLKRLLTIQDVSCVGQCSATVALPLISACGVECAVLPSAVLSNHTAGFTAWRVDPLRLQPASRALLARHGRRLRVRLRGRHPARARRTRRRRPRGGHCLRLHRSHLRRPLVRRRLRANDPPPRLAPRQRLTRRLAPSCRRGPAANGGPRPPNPLRPPGLQQPQQRHVLSPRPRWRNVEVW